jgi:hypothetical protein
MANAFADRNLPLATRESAAAFSQTLLIIRKIIIDQILKAAKKLTD